MGRKVKKVDIKEEDYKTHKCGRCRIPILNEIYHHLRVELSPHQH